MIILPTNIITALVNGVGQGGGGGAGGIVAWVGWIHDVCQIL